MVLKILGGIVLAVGLQAQLVTPPPGGGGGGGSGTVTSVTCGTGLTGGTITTTGTCALAGALPAGTTATTGGTGGQVATNTDIANAIAGVNPAVAVQAATTLASDTSALTYNNGASGVGATFTGANNTALTVDGYTFTAIGQRLLVKNDTQSPSGAFNGIYSVTQVQASVLPLILTRALDYDQPSDMNNTGAIPVQNGTLNGSTSWLLTSQIVTVGTTPLTFTQFSVNPATQVTAASSAASSKQTCVSSGASKTCTYIDFPSVQPYPSAICPGGSPGAGWSYGSTAVSNSGGPACRAGTNNIGGYIAITDTAATFAQFQVPIPADWDTATNPYIAVGLISVTDTTNGHTVIPQIQISCPTATNGTVTDDHAFAAAHPLATITFGASAVANGFYTTSVQMNSTDMTGCVAGGFMIVQIGRATDTGTGVIGFSYANITWPRLLATGHAN